MRLPAIELVMIMCPLFCSLKWPSEARIESAHAEHVRVDHRLPVLHGLLEEAARGAEAGVREVGVHAAEAVERRLDDGLLVVPARHVAAHGDRLLVAAELLRERLELVLGARGEHDAVAELDRAVSGGGADAGAGAGDRLGLVASAMAEQVTLLRAWRPVDPTEARFPAVPREARATTRAST